uniref:Uncharacterized protein n=1 Tax=Siphoviridae sp. ctYKh4 TaxID=2823586 RepID=A0A8S5LCJ6_9CAUD|nr:MAG TPA: hypothetical protein [Siphoviridae sp. ctYKh4]
MTGLMLFCFQAHCMKNNFIYQLYFCPIFQ